MRIEYDFLRVGSFVEPRPGYIYIDVGNQSVPGIIDTHPDTTDSDNFTCSTALVVSRPALVTEWITDKDMKETVCLVMHERPDYDCIASAFLVRRLLEARASGDAFPRGWEEWAPLVAESARRIDRGETRLHLPIASERPPLTPYLSMIALHDQIARDARTPRESWAAMIERGQEILGRALHVAAQRGTTDLNAVDLRGELAAFGDMEAIIDCKIQAFTRDAARVGLHSGRSSEGGLDGIYDVRLPLRDQTAAAMTSRIACILDPESGAAFFKSVIRGAHRDSIQATCIFETVPPDPAAGTARWTRPIISVDPDSPFDLRGLGHHLDVLETEVRARLGVARAGRPRPGFDNSDPWYDGRGFAYTIVDAPRWGTVLSPEVVLQAVRDSDRWIHLRIGSVVVESLEQMRTAADAGMRRKAFTAVLEAVDEWHASRGPRHPMYRECVDSVVRLAEEADVARNERLLTQLSDVLLGLLRNGSAAVRAQALAVAARAAGFEKHARSCERKDVLPLLEIASSDEPQRVVRLLAQGGNGAGDELLLDAVAARIRLRPRIEEQVVAAAATLAGRAVDLPRTHASVIELSTMVSRSGSAAAAALERHAERPTLGPDHATLHHVRHLIGERRPGQAARVFAAMLEDQTGLTTDRKRDVLDLAESLLECLRVQAGDEIAASDVDIVLSRILIVFAADELLRLWSESAVAAAQRTSPAFVGALIRIARESVTARWALVAAALDRRWSAALDEARGFVLEPDDARIHANAESLTRVGIAPAAAPAAACGAPRSAFLLLAAARARGVALNTSAHEVLTDMLAVEDVSADPARLRRMRRLVADELRHASPDHFLLADAESCLEKAEMFGWMIALAGAQDSVSGRAVVLLLRIAANLPEIRWADVDDLLQLKRTYRPGSSAELDAIAEHVLACAEQVAGVRHGQVFIADAARINAAATFLEKRVVDCLGTPIGRAVAIAIHAVQAVLDTYAGLIEAAGAEKREAIEALSVRMLEASTLIRFAADWRAFPKTTDAEVMLRLTARLAGASDEPSTRRWYSAVRGALGVSYEHAERRLARLADRSPRAEGGLRGRYERIRDLLALPAEALDFAYARMVDALISRYDIHSARRCVDDYSFDRFPALLRFWMSGWTVVIPLLFIGLFALGKGGPIEAAMIGLAVALVAVIGLGWRHQKRKSGTPRVVAELRYRLFLPQYVVPVLVGVYTAAIGHEVASHLAMQLPDYRYVMLTAGCFAAATWALGQLIRRHGGKASTRNVVVTACRLFAYGFIIALALNTMLSPILEYDGLLHHKRWEWISDGRPSHHHHIPMTIESVRFRGDLVFFPRHIMLDAVFGMFVAIVLREFLKAGEGE